MMAEIQKDSGEYIEAVKRIQKIYEERIRKLNEVRKNFPQRQTQRVPRKTGYEIRTNPFNY